MSHTVTVKVEMKNKEALNAAIQRLDKARFVKPGSTRANVQYVNTIDEATGEHNLFTRGQQGIGVHFDGWHYPVIINPETGELKYDNYNGRWGSQKQLDELVQGYTVEQARQTAMLQGLTVTEQKETNGDIKLVVNDYRS